MINSKKTNLTNLSELNKSSIIGSPTKSLNTDLIIRLKKIGNVNKIRTDHTRAKTELIFQM